MRAPLHRRTEKIGACIADPSANGEGSEEIDTLTIPDGGRRRVYRPDNRVARDRADSQPPERAFLSLHGSSQGSSMADFGPLRSVWLIADRIMSRDFLSLYFAHLNLKRCRTRFEEAD